MQFEIRYARIGDRKSIDDNKQVGSYEFGSEINVDGMCSTEPQEAEFIRCQEEDTDEDLQHALNPFNSIKSGDVSIIGVEKSKDLVMYRAILTPVVSILYMYYGIRLYKNTKLLTEVKITLYVLQ